MKQFKYVFYTLFDAKVNVREELHKGGINGISLLFVLNNYPYSVIRFINQKDLLRQVKDINESGKAEMVTENLYFSIQEETS